MQEECFYSIFATTGDDFDANICGAGVHACSVLLALLQLLSVVIMYSNAVVSLHLQLPLTVKVRVIVRVKIRVRVRVRVRVRE